MFIEMIEYRNTNLDEKILNSISLDNFQIETDTGFKPASHIHITKPFTIYELILENGLHLNCADTHIVFDKNFNEVFVKDLTHNSHIQTKLGLIKVKKVIKHNSKVSMFDITVDDDNHRFYSNDILSHNTIMTAIYLVHYSLFNFDRNSMLLSNKGDTTKEILDKIKVIFENLPFFLKPGILKNDVMTMKFDNGCRIIAQNTTKRSGLSFTLHNLYIDEAAHIPENIINEFYENVYPTISSSKISRIILTSTQNGFNLFQELYDAAEAGLNEYIPHKVDWWEVPEHDDAWMKAQVAQLGSEEAFLRQYGTEWMTSDSRLLSPEHIKKLEASKKFFVLREFYELLDLNIDYEKYLSFAEDFDINNTKDKEHFYVFSIDIAEGGGGTSDSSVINMFEIDLIDKSNYENLLPVSIHDFFGLKQIGIFKSNELAISDFAKVLYTILLDVFDIENVKLIIEINTYGNELIKDLGSVFQGDNEFDDECIVKFIHKIDSKIPNYGLKIKNDNKPILAQNFKKYFHIGKIELYEQDTIKECIVYGKDKNGNYKGLGPHDDIVSTCINACEVFKTMDFADYVEEKFDLLSSEIQKEIEAQLELVDGGNDAMQYDLYSIIQGGANTTYSNDKPNFDFI